MEMRGAAGMRSGVMAGLLFEGAGTVRRTSGGSGPAVRGRRFGAGGSGPAVRGRRFGTAVRDGREARARGTGREVSKTSGRRFGAAVRDGREARAGRRGPGARVER
ncbi:hypothetical protein GCM10011609_13790 [Lentzea pudingi]|uniref:Uncharacterized protein n=1 Tax=Lentzea pudingi TaxID=1789439 RepID=A0ABQ2HGS7_9PSEU|nr:hypothetical protein GCM10011609_13790 [Lentzea pudingi]